MKTARRPRSKKAPKHNLDASLARLEEAQLVRRAEEEERAYLFKHTLTQETAYQSLLLKTRREVHRRVAESIEKLDAEHLDENAALLARHYAEAGDDAKTLEYEIRAGDAAAHLYAHAEALGHYSRALDLVRRADGAVSHPSLLQELFLKRGRILELSGKFDLALESYEEMERLALERSSRGMELAALMARATILSVPTTVLDIPGARSLSEKALELARYLRDQAAEAKILWNLMLLNSRLELRLEEAVRCGEQSLAIARSLNLREQLAYTLNDLGLTYGSVGEFEQAEQALEEAAGMWREMNDLPMLTDNLSNAAANYVAEGNLEDSIAPSQEALQISQRIGNLWGEAFSQVWVASAYVELGRLAEARTVMEHALRLAVESGFVAPLVISRADLGRLYGDLGEIERGLELIQLALGAADRSNIVRVWALAAAAHLYALQGDLSRAAQAVQEARAVFALDDSTLRITAPFRLAEAELVLAERDFERALVLLEALADAQRQHRMRQFLPAALYAQAQALMALGRQDEAQAILSEAREVAEDMQARWTLWRILGALSEIEAKRGRPEEAERLGAEAREIVEFIAVHTPPELRESFQSLAAVRQMNGGQSTVGGGR